MKQSLSSAVGVLEDEKKLISFCFELTHRRNQCSPTQIGKKSYNKKGQQKLVNSYNNNNLKKNLYKYEWKFNLQDQLSQCCNPYWSATILSQVQTFEDFEKPFVVKVNMQDKYSAKKNNR